MTAADLSQRFDFAGAPTFDAVPEKTFPSQLQSLPSQVKTLLARLVSPGDLFQSTATTNLTSSALLAKRDAIRSCLLGDDQGRVNLWLLRELALSPGGLLTPELRKIAWPKLVGVHVALASADRIPSVVTPSASCLAALRQGVAKTTWNVHECLRALRDYQKAMDRKLVLQWTAAKTRTRNDSVIISSTVHKSVRFAHTHDGYCASPLLPKHLYDDADEDHSDSKSSASPHPLDLSPTNSTTSASESDNSALEDIKSVVVFNTKEATFISPLASVTRPNKKASPTVRKPSSTSEQMALYKIIQQLLCTAPNEEAINDLLLESAQDGYHYTSSLPDVAALLWIHLQSPSLTTVVLQQLATFQLRDALVGVGELETAVATTTVAALLERLDPELHRLVADGPAKESIAVFARHFVTGSWLTGLDLPIAARLADAFLVSHALFPIYACVTLLMERRQECTEAGSLDAPTDASVSSFYDEQLSTTLTAAYKERMDSVTAAEEIIQTALDHMKAIPPKELLAMANETCARDVRITALLATAGMMSKPPDWMLSLVAPGDHELAKSTRVDEECTSLGIERAASVATAFIALFRNDYPRAKAALGQPARVVSARTWVRVSFVVVAATIVLYLSFSSSTVVVSQVATSSASNHMVPNERLAFELIGKVASPTVMSIDFTKDFMPTSNQNAIVSVGVCWANETTFRDVVWKPTAASKEGPLVNSTAMSAGLLFNVLKHHDFVARVQAMHDDIVHKLMDQATRGELVVNKIKEETLSKFKKYEPEWTRIQEKCRELPGDMNRELRDFLAWAQPLSDTAWMDCV